MQNELLDRYIYNVGQELPRNRRADIEAEIRSNLEEALETRASETGKPVDDDLVVEMLREFGSPEQVAGGYREPRHLIGPAYYPLFILVLKIVTVVLGALALVNLALNLGTPGMTLVQVPKVVLESVLDFFGGFLSAFANIVIVFAILDRFVPDMDRDEKTWDPRKMEKKPQGEKVSQVGTIIGIVMTFIVILLFNFYPEVLAVYSSQNGVWTISPLFTPLFFTYVPILTILLAADIIKNLLILRKGTKSTGIRWYEVILDLAGIVLMVVILRGGAIIQPNLIQNAEILAEPVLVALFSQLANLILIIIIVVSSIDVVSNLYHLLIKNKPTTLPYQS